MHRAMVLEQFYLKTNVQLLFSVTPYPTPQRLPQVHLRTGAHGYCLRRPKMEALLVGPQVHRLNRSEKFEVSPGATARECGSPKVAHEAYGVRLQYSVLTWVGKQGCGRSFSPSFGRLSYGPDRSPLSPSRRGRGPCYQ